MSQAISNSGRRVLLGATALALLAGGAVAATTPWRSEPAASVHDSSPGPAAAVATGAKPAPSKPPAPMCGSNALDGPATAPAGAKVIRNQHLGRAAQRAAPGTVFWIAPGTHTLGEGQYDQVMPKRNQVFIGAPGAIIDGQNKNQYAFTGHATGVEIRNLTIVNFGNAGETNNEGVVNHDAGDNWKIVKNTVADNAGAGVFIGSGTKVIGNCLRDNGQYGFSAYEPDGVRDVVLRRNEITGNNTDDWESLQENCGCSGGGKFWDTRNAVIAKNWVHDNRGVGLWADTNNTGFLIKGNLIEANDSQGLFYETSYNAKIVSNTFKDNGWKEGPTNPSFPAGAIYLSESGSTTDAPGRFGRHLLVAKNRFVNNWAGIMAWENADRFAGSPANTSSGYSTLGSGVSEKACSNPDNIDSEPYLSGCRWKTQNLRVVDNSFVLDPAAVPGCTKDAGCGYMGLVSNYGTYPDWSPYQGYMVPNNITFEQNNHWAENTYTGPWRFMIRTLGNTVSWSTWTSKKFGQDSGSVRK